ncbi:MULTISPECIES: HAD family hydrolase [Mycolicibacterium]|uniref:HAD family hydrolase n=1 Tax=Mycobacteriaceae TaxID=1762 RepID=UPI0012FEC313
MTSSLRVLSAFRRRRITTVLTTGLDRETFDLLLRSLGWTDIADFTLSGDDVPRGRPAPDLILTAFLRASTVDIRDVLTVGDTTNNLMAAHRAGVINSYRITGGAQPLCPGSRPTQGDHRLYRRVVPLRVAAATLAPHD